MFIRSSASVSWIGSFDDSHIETVNIKLCVSLKKIQKIDLPLLPKDTALKCSSTKLIKLNCSGCKSEVSIHAGE
jgi:hypothetical protein